MPKHLFLLCEDLAEELRSLDRSNLPESEVILETFRGNCTDPNRGMRDSLPEDLDLADFDSVDVLCGPCIRIPEDAENVHVRRLGFCFETLLNPETLRHYVDRGYYLCTPAWVCNWRDNIAPWGFDRDTLVEFFAHLPGGVLLLDTGSRSEAAESLATFAEYIEKPHHILPVGTDYLERVLGEIYLRRHMEITQEHHRETTLEHQRRLSNYAMSFEILRQVAASRDEREVQDYVLEMFNMFFHPEDIRYIPAQDIPEGEDPTVYRENGFRLPLVHDDTLFGAVDVRGLTFPEYRDQYLTTALSLLDVSALAIANARHYAALMDLANTDGLTRIPNRRRFDEYLHRTWLRASVAEEPIALLMADIDYFKPYNDRYGHGRGDDCLKRVARAIARECIRPTDMVARYGGEEFVVVLPNADLEAACKVAERIQRSIEDLHIPHETSEVADHLTISIGVAHARPKEEFHGDALLKRSDEALYRAKEAGRNRVYCIPEPVE
ncbi:MAG: diguanylate cyclase [Bacillota bacterium]